MSKARQIAISGVFSALSFVLMFMSSFMPLTFLWVQLSGFVIMVIMVETGRRNAFLAYVAVTLMCFILLPNTVIIMEFALIIGYYPIIKMWLDNIERTFVRRAVKLAIFLVLAATSLFVSAHIFGIATIGLGFYLAIPIGQMTIFCMVNDYLLGHIHQYYATKIRPNIFEKE